MYKCGQAWLDMTDLLAATWEAYDRWERRNGKRCDILRNNYQKEARRCSFIRIQPEKVRQRTKQLQRCDVFIGTVYSFSFFGGWGGLVL